MKHVRVLVLILICSVPLFSEKYVEKGFSFYSPKALSLGNSYTAEASGIESFEFNSAGLVKKDEWTIFSSNSILISNIFELNQDLLDGYNEVNAESKTFLGPSELIFMMKPENVRILMLSLLKQVSVPDDGGFANGLGYIPVISSTFIKKGFGIGFTMSLDTEFIGDNLTSTELKNTLTAALLVGYARSIDLGIIKLDAGGCIRPMYRIKADTKLSPLLSLIEDDSSSVSGEDFFKKLDYLTGLGIAWDLGIKGYYKDLTVALSFIDMFGTSFTYSENSYENLINGDYLGGNEVLDKYIVPMSIRLGLSYNPFFGNFNNILNPTISLDYKLLLDEGSYSDYIKQDSFWVNLSMGLNLELFKKVHLRSGINQGYITMGAGFTLSAVEINGTIYSKELGQRVGHRQQMGAGIDIAFKL